MQAIRSDLQNALTRGDPAHAGLILSRYLKTPYSNTDEYRTARDGLHSAAKRAIDQTHGLYEKAFLRWKASLTVDDNSSVVQSQKMETIGRMIVGLGGEHVTETGITLHHVYGVPYIPGSALKGLASHYCHQVWGQSHEDPVDEQIAKFRIDGDHHTILFGTKEFGGLISFLDAWIDPESLLDSNALQVDVLTPHHGDYYSGNNPAPTDFDDPNPIGFLSVRGSFLVAVATLDTNDQAASWCNLAMTLLQEALTEWGVGGKTSSGYGRLMETSKVATAQPTKPQHAAKTRVTVTRIEDPKGRGRIWYQADDGFRGVIPKDNDPHGVEIGEETELIIKSVNIKDGYYSFGRLS